MFLLSAGETKEQGEEVPYRRQNSKEWTLGSSREPRARDMMKDDPLPSPLFLVRSLHLLHVHTSYPTCTGTLLPLHHLQRSTTTHSMPIACGNGMQLTRQVVRWYTEYSPPRNDDEARHSVCDGDHIKHRALILALTLSTWCHLQYSQN